MFKNIKEIDYNWLRNNHERIYFFGLGFIQLKINETYRLHFYIPELPSFVDHPHNHRYDFESTILKGEFTNNIYKEVTGLDFIIQEDSCSEGFIPTKKPRNANFELVSSTTYTTGETYSMNHETFHTVKADRAITLLKRSAYKKELADVAYPSNQKKVCPFMSKLSEDLLWDYIKQELN
jgi:hypothetical protein